MNGHRNSARKLGSVLLVVSMATAACGGASAASEPGEVISVSGYEPVFDGPEDAIQFVGSPLVVVAVTTGAGEARWNGPDGRRPTSEELEETGRPEFIWVPIEVRVAQVLRGDTQGRENLIVRSLGGRIADTIVDFDALRTLPPLEPGTRLVLFLNEEVDAGDGVLASTPNHVYVVEGGIARSANGTHEVPFADLVRMIKQPEPPVIDEEPGSDTTVATSTTIAPTVDP